MNGISGNPALKLWKPVMQAIHKDLAKINFPSCSGVTTAKYCLVTGKIATETCSGTGTGYFKKDYMPKCDGEGHAVTSTPPNSSGAASSGTASENVSGGSESGAASSGATSSTPPESESVSSTPASSEAASQSAA